MPSLDPINDELIPWSSLRGAVLEELLYELLNEMGAKELSWRSGGTGGGAPDGGRDLEATFYNATPDGEVERQKWWIEAKGRTRTVEPDAVKSAVFNAAGNAMIDLIVVATNSQFSNPTRDWVQGWVGDNPRPKVKLWDRRDLLRLIRRHPVVAARVIPQVLSSGERLRMLTDQLYRFGKPPSHKDLDYYWEMPDAVQEPDQLAAMVYGELIYGDLSKHPWGAMISEDNCLSVLIEAVVGLPFALLGSQALSNTKMVAAAAYMVECALQWADPTQAALIMARPLDFVEGIPASMKEDPEPYVDAVVRPIWERCKLELLDACSQDCARISSSPDDLAILRPSEADKRFWLRFGAGDNGEDDFVLRAINLGMPCSVGLQLGERVCPLNEGPNFTEEEIEELKTIINYRKVHPSGRYTEIASEHSPIYQEVARQFEEFTQHFLGTSRDATPSDDSSDDSTPSNDGRDGEL